MVLVKNFKFCERFVLCTIHPEIVFGDVLLRKEACQDNINMDLKRRQNWHFCKGVSPWFFGQKFDILSTFRFMQDTPRKRYLVTFSLEKKPF